MSSLKRSCLSAQRVEAQPRVKRYENVSDNFECLILGWYGLNADIRAQHAQPVDVLTAGSLLQNAGNHTYTHSLM